jgi:hypothetical protein
VRFEIPYPVSPAKGHPSQIVTASFPSSSNPRNAAQPFVDERVARLATVVRIADYTDMWSALDRYSALEATLSVVPQIIPQEALELSEVLEGKIRSHFE